ncbi:MAG: hypothetical protein ABL982_17825 [Vicinamibacterales bacterium]
MPHLMRATAMQSSGVEHPIEHLAHIRFVERCPGHGGEDPVGEGLPMGQPFGALPAAPQAEFGAQLRRHVDTALLMVLGRRELPTDVVASHHHVRATPIDVAPLQGQHLAGSHARPEAAQQPREHVGKLVARDLDQLGDLVPGERIDF